jgi:hypothetical protein
LDPEEMVNLLQALRFRISHLESLNPPEGDLAKWVADAIQADKALATKLDDTPYTVDKAT